MLILGLILAAVTLGFLCWLLFNLAVYALPCFVGISAAFWSYHHGSGIFGAMLVALLGGAATSALGQLAFAQLRAPLARGSIALLFAAPAAIAGFYAALGLARNAGAGLHWSQTFAVLGALMVGGTALVRLAVSPSRSGETSPHRTPLPNAARSVAAQTRRISCLR